VDLVRRLVVEPVWIAVQLKPTGILADIGSGNGSPAIPLHVCRRFWKCHLIEARTKRAALLRHVATTLKLSDVSVHRARFEEVSTELGRPDWITLQAVALSQKLLDSIWRITSPTTTIVWITSSGVSPLLQPVRILDIPFTGTRVLLFQRDLS
jgi:16S rRNA (guanine527-N7)-methyltransferase